MSHPAINDGSDGLPAVSIVRLTDWQRFCGLS